MISINATCPKMLKKCPKSKYVIALPPFQRLVVESIIRGLGY